MALVFKYIWLGLYLWHMIHKLGNNILCRLVLYDKVYGFGNTTLFEVLIGMRYGRVLIMIQSDYLD
jgi:hypothetical protein